MINKINLIEKLNKSKIIYKEYTHEALFSVEDSHNKRGKIDGAHSKNLFLKNKKGKYFLLSCLEKTKINLKKFSKSLKLGNISFAKESDLKNLLGVFPGSVTPFGLINDTENKIKFYLDNDFLSYKTANFHPLINTSTLNLDVTDMIKFLVENNKKVNIFNFSNYSLID